LAESEKVLWPIVTHQAFHDRFVTGPNAWIAKLREFLRIPFATQYFVDDGQPSRARNITDDMMDCQVHLIQSLLHVMSVACRHLDETVSMSRQRSNRTNILGGAEKRT
jgi:hypothetical protein